MIKEMNRFSVCLASASACFLPYLLLLAFILLFDGASVSEYQNADPLVRFFGHPATTIATLIIGFVISLYWIKAYSVSRARSRSRRLTQCLLLVSPG